MLSEQSPSTIFQRLQRVGRAIGEVNGNNTHSGNLSMRDPDNPDRFYITASGSQTGDLVPQDIVPIHFSGVSWGDARGSTESTIHRKVLLLPGVNAVVHAHFFNSTAISFDGKDHPLFLQYLGNDEKNREEFAFLPVDLYGAQCVGAVRVGSYFQPVGSAEMEERIPRYLSKDRLTIVRGHGSFVRGTSPEEALWLISLLESSAALALHLRRLGVDVTALQQFIQDRQVSAFFPGRVHEFQEIDFARQDVRDVTVQDDFRQRLTYNYDHQLCAFGAGSMSQKISAGTMIYCPMAAVPRGFEFPLCRLSLAPSDDDDLDMRLHKLIYRQTHQNTCMITTSPLALAEGMAILHHEFGMGALNGLERTLPYEPDRHPVLRPIDAEAIYLNPRLGLTDLWQLTNMTPENPILNMLRWYKGCCIVSGYGVVSTGETTLEQAGHNAASAERIARFRAEVAISEAMAGGLPVRHFEPGHPS